MSGSSESALVNERPSLTAPAEPPEPKKITRDDFTFHELLGEGSFAKVFRATQNATGKEFAIKVLDKKHIVKENKVEQVKVERNVLNDLDHPFIIKLYCTFQDATCLYMVLENAPGGDLFNIIKKAGALDLPYVVYTTATLLLALEYLHGKGYVHRDLKPENVLIGKDERIRLTDFGTAKKIRTESSRRNSFTGTAEYVSPEVLRDKEAGPEADLWALGCIVFQMLAGRPPFRAGSDYLTFQQILKLEYSFPPMFPAPARDFVERLLVLDPTVRPNVAQLKAHPMFEGLDWDKLRELPVPPPTPAPYAAELVEAQRKAGAAASERARMLAEQAKSPWARFLLPNELIVYSGLVVKRVGLSSKKRQLILTDTPRLLYIDPEKLVQKGEIPWSTQLRAEIRNDRQFHVHVPGRTYNLEDISLGAARWVEMITQQQQHAQA